MRRDRLPSQRNRNAPKPNETSISKIPENPKGTRTICGQGANGLIRSAIESKTTPAHPIFERIIQSIASVKLWDHQRSSKQFHDASSFANFAMRIDVGGCSCITVCGVMASVLMGLTLSLLAISLDDFQCSQRASSRLRYVVAPGNPFT